MLYSTQIRWENLKEIKLFNTLKFWTVWTSNSLLNINLGIVVIILLSFLFKFLQNLLNLKSIDYKKTVVQFSFLSKKLSFLLKSKHFRKKMRIVHLSS